jgi:hypothetical protein
MSSPVYVRPWGYPSLLRERSLDIPVYLSPRPDALFPGRSAWACTASVSEHLNYSLRSKRSASSVSKCVVGLPAGPLGMRLHAWWECRLVRHSLALGWKPSTSAQPILRAGTPCTEKARCILPVIFTRQRFGEPWMNYPWTRRRSHAHHSLLQLSSSVGPS